MHTKGGTYCNHDYIFQGYKTLNDSSGSAKADQSLRNLISPTSVGAHCDKLISLIPNLEYVRMG